MTHAELQQRSCLSYWFPKLVETGVPVPRTVVIKTGLFAHEILDPSPETKVAVDELVCQIRGASIAFGAPFFLRTGMGSGKHEWRRTCFVTDRDHETIARHVVALAEWSECASILGLPADVWVIREYHAPAAAFFAFEGLPIAPEVRFFIEAGRLVHRRFYWPDEAIRNPSREDWPALLEACRKLARHHGEPLLPLVRTVANAFRDEGAWSLDFMYTFDGWLAIDMAAAALSWGCPASLKPVERVREDPDGAEGLTDEAAAQFYHPRCAGYPEGGS